MHASVGQRHVRVLILRYSEFLENAPVVRFLPLVMSVFLAGCALPVVHPDFETMPADADPDTFECCNAPNRYPQAFVDFAMPLVEPFFPLFMSGSSPAGLAPHPEAGERIARQAQPMDLLLLSSKSHFTSRYLPGWFTHSAVYLGTEAQLRTAGLWNDPAVLPYRDKIRAGYTIVEAMPSGIRFNAMDPLHWERDAALLARPTLTAAERRTALRQALGSLQHGFDFFYDVRSCDKLACTEVVLRAMPQLDFTIREVNQQIALLPDDIAAQAVRGDRLRVVDYVRVDGDSWESTGRRGVMEDLSKYWGPIPDKPQTAVYHSGDLERCEPGVAMRPGFAALTTRTPRG